MTAQPGTRQGGERCAVHPARPAVDRCPVCDRARCGADAAAGGGGCLACIGSTVPAPSTAAPAPDLERLVRAALAAFAVSLLGGVVAGQYVGAGLFSYVFPFVVGVLCGGAATKAAPTDGRGPLGVRVRAIGAVTGVLGVAVGFLEERSQEPVSFDPDVLLPYLFAVAGAVLWTVPPRPRRGQGASTDV